MKHKFERWENNSTNPTRTINVKEDIKITAYYKEVSPVGKVTFQGSVSAQAEAGELVTITVTRPDTTTEEVLTMTNEDLTFSVEYENVAGDYSAKARIEADELYEAAESDEIPFSIGKEPRTIELSVA